ILGQLITVMGTSKNFDKTLKGYKLGAGVLWRHSLEADFGSKMIAEDKYPVLDKDCCKTAGLSVYIIFVPYLWRQPSSLRKLLNGVIIHGDKQSYFS
ncbi:MAG: hypothetical protein DRH24_07520, partial [Deltaproteobacteria bacterium]